MHCGIFYGKWLCAKHKDMLALSKITVRKKGGIHTDNKRNEHSPKNLKSQYGEFQIDVPRDRNGEFEPKLIPKYQRDISGIEEKVISLYARGMSTRDIHDQLLDSMELSCQLKWSAKLQIRSCPMPKNGRHAR